MSRLLTFLAFSFCVTTQLLAGVEERPLSLVPQPNHFEILSGVFTVTDDLKIVVADGGLADEADYLKAALAQTTGFDFLITKNVSANTSVVLKLDSSIKGDESYQIRSSEKQYEIIGSTPAGVFYGIQTFLQLFPPLENGAVNLPLISVDDEPRFEWRGMHLDVCRHFYPVEVVKKLIDQMAKYKLNVFHWHLTEDQGWRIEIKKYPKLTEVGAWRDETVVGHMADTPHRFDGEKHGGYYTQEQIKDVVAYAQARHVTIVPEIEMPGHAQAALAAYPWLGCFNDTLKPWTLWGVSENVYCAGKESTFKFLEDVLDEVCELFPGQYVHVGGDECPKANWKKCPLCQKRMKEEGLKDEHELQSYFIQRMEHYLETKGKKLIGWDEILEGGLAENAAVMSWRGEKGGIAAAEMGHKVVMTPGNWCYFDHYQSTDPNEPTAIGGLTDLEEVYSYNPVPAHLDKDKQKLIMGTQANVWTEYIPTVEQLEYMIYPRLCALAEVQWTQPEHKDYADFERRMDDNYLRLAKDGIHLRVPPPEGLSPLAIFSSKVATIKLTCAAGSAVMRYTTDGSEPTEFSKAYDGPLTLKPDGDVTLKVASFLKDGTRSYTVTSILKKQELKPVKLKNPEKGLECSYYDGPFRAIAEITGEPVKTVSTEGLVIPKTIKGKNKGWEFNGFIELPKDGIYYFLLDSGCGSGMYLGDQLVIGDDGFNYNCMRAGQVELKAGYYPVKIKLFNTIYGQQIKLSYKLPGSDELVEVPADSFYRK